MNRLPHTPVLLNEFLEFFQKKKLKVFFDGTLGAGGHAEALLKAHPEIEKFIGVDKDKTALAYAREKLLPWSKKTILIQGNFSDLDQFLQEEKIDHVDGFFFDLGTSSMQIAEKKRGFSFMKEGPLDMRMGTGTFLTAEKVLNEFSEKKLSEIFKEYGEEKLHKQIAHAIVEARRKKKIKTTLELVEVLKPIFSKKKRGRIHFATLVFQALRIYVNKELESIETGVKSAIDALKNGGRIGVISFHSLEDRIIKRTFKESNQLKVLTKKPIRPTDNEVKSNPRSRSAKLRFAEKCKEVSCN